MHIVTKIFIALVAIEHLYILWLEMFAWTTRGPKVFKGSLRPDLFEPTKVLAANQGLYNGFLAAGLLWALLITDPTWQKNVAIFFLSCVIVAALYGGYSASKRIILMQGLPALITLALLLAV
ncbi:DUF1304 domain-containing protein [Fibrella aquatilis]|uniref:DUF1304 domain-containing protein n=1 Tax=Fibrella aquatilis TaxID=2817059 RepID=A0A939G2G6_9BACT|nr:DUF1304 domain-containing protein [Fibrella aquatilis]MBO0929953.1 DUF1304 domain-containing protein [Fibrella aquatilis]